MTEFTDGPSRAAKLLTRHQAETGFEGDAEIILLHVLGDIIEWCDANRVDFDLQVDSAREMLIDALDAEDAAGFREEMADKIQRRRRHKTMTDKLLPCPFCGGEATIEEIEIGIYGTTRFSVGCSNADEENCMGYQSLTTFARKSDAAAAWNKRDVRPLGAR